MINTQIPFGMTQPYSITFGTSQEALLGYNRPPTILREPYLPRHLFSPRVEIT